MVWHVDPVKAAQLNLRDHPKTGSVLVTLPQGTEINKISAAAQDPLWWFVSVTLNDQTLQGFVHSGYLKSGSGGAINLGVAAGIPAAHLSAGGYRRADDNGRAFPLDEPSMPRRGNGSAAQKAADILKIIDYLRPDRESHRRYQPGGGKTYCNIYAYDFARCMGVFVPRVWWTSAALGMIENGNVPAVLYGNTVREMNANMIHDWFIDYGGGFGWARVFDTDALQNAANGGKACIIVAKRVNVARSGHILAVVPEQSGVSAARSGGVVVRPVQSQAGSTNFTAKVTTTRWWLDPSRFQSFGFWVHD